MYKKEKNVKKKEKSNRFLIPDFSPEERLKYMGYNWRLA